MHFDIVDMGWTKETFEEEKKFVISIIDAAIKRTWWEILPYKPDEDNVFESLEKFKGLVQHFSREMIEEEKREFRVSPYDVCKSSDKFKKGAKHEVYTRPSK